jgi:glycosyltransferase involved in cell wall biosynthesis
VQLADSLASVIGMGVTLLSQSMPNEPVVRPKVKGVDCRVREAASRQALRLGLPVRTELTQIGRQTPPSLIHNHGLWLPVNYWASSAARRLGLPLVIHPRGMLEPWALQHKGAKKRLAMALFQRRDLETAKVLVATSAVEYRNIRNLGFTMPIAIIPNGIELVPEDSGGAQPLHNAELRTVLFLSRVHQIKGLINLVHAWAQVQPAGWRLQIAGPDEGGHLAEVMHEARKAGIEASVDYLGEVDGAQKAAVYRNADLFVLPTFSENFGVVVAEALSHGLPVITTRGAPWADLETHDCGWWIDIGVESLAAALRQAVALSDDERRTMGERGRAYVQRYNWDDIARQMAEVYRWVLDGGTPPACVRMD